MLSVRERGHFVATLRFAYVSVMETLAAWVPTTPEMEVKLLFGEHIWDAAQHADSLGKRTFELRMPLQRSTPAADGYRAFLATVAELGPTPQRLAAMYDVLLPALVGRQRRYLDGTDPLIDAPTVRILERHFADAARMSEGARALRQELPALQLADPEWAAALRRREASLEMVAAPAPEAVATVGA